MILALIFSSVVGVQTPATAPAKPAVPMPAPTPEFLNKGRLAYMSTCIRCHNRDPNIKGSLGPELIDAPLELMKTKVETGRYPEKLPPGFVPKRKTKVMTKLPNSVKDVPAIWAWIQTQKKKK